MAQGPEVQGSIQMAQGPEVQGSNPDENAKWKDSHPAVVEHDCPEINSSQR